MALAGVMGGEEREVSDATTTILLGVSQLRPQSVRRTARAPSLPSEASGRFQRGVDPNLAWSAIQRFVALLAQVAPDATAARAGRCLPRTARTGAPALPLQRDRTPAGHGHPARDGPRHPDAARLSAASGRAGARRQSSPSPCRPTVRTSRCQPTWLKKWRASTATTRCRRRCSSGQAVPVQRDPARLVDRVAQDALVAAGLQQVITYSMLSEADLRALSPANDAIPDLLGGYPKPEADFDFVRAVNPLRADWELMRPTLLPSLLKIVAENRKIAPGVAIFETARVYEPVSLDEAARRAPHGSAGVSGVASRSRGFTRRVTTTRSTSTTLKAPVEVLLDRLGRPGEFVAVEHPSLQPGRAAAIVVGGAQIGVHRRVASARGRAFWRRGPRGHRGIGSAVFPETLLEAWDAQPISRFQPVRQDFAVVVDASTPAGAVREALFARCHPLATGGDAVRHLPRPRHPGRQAEPGLQRHLLRPRPPAGRARDRTPAHTHREGVGQAGAGHVAGTMRIVEGRERERVPREGSVARLGDLHSVDPPRRWRHDICGSTPFAPANAARLGAREGPPTSGETRHGPCPAGARRSRGRRAPLRSPSKSFPSLVDSPTTCRSPLEKVHSSRVHHRTTTPPPARNRAPSSACAARTTARRRRRRASRRCARRC